jgi:large repetitive protein
MNGILESEQLNPSLKALNPADARYGNGQYRSDIAPGVDDASAVVASISRDAVPGSHFTNWVEIDVSGLNVVQGRPSVFVVPNEGPRPNNPFHCTLCSITPDQAEQPFTPTVPNPSL